MTGKLYLHIGAHKTASTLIQRILKGINEELANHGTLFLPNVYELSNQIRDLSPLTDAQHIMIRDQLNAIQKEGNFNSIILSSERFFGFPRLAYENIGDIAKDLGEILRDFDVEVLAFVRRQDTFIESYYHQVIKWGEDWTFRQYIDNLDVHAYRWDKLLDNYAKVFGEDRITVIPFESIKHEENNGIKHFFRIIGVNLLDPISKWQQANPSYSKKGLEIARVCNPILDEEERKLMRKFIEANFFKGKNEDFDLFTDEERRDLLEFYRPSNEALFSRYVNGFDAEYYIGG